METADFGDACTLDLSGSHSLVNHKRLAKAWREKGEQGVLEELKKMYPEKAESSRLHETTLEQEST